MKTVAAILGSAYGEAGLGGVALVPEAIDTPWGTVELHKVRLPEREAWVVFRHGLPHRLLPNQINYRGIAHALKTVGVGALMVTSSVGVMDGDVPLYAPLLVSDLLMPDNRLPDGTACTMFTEPSPEHGHLVLSEGLFSPALGDQLKALGQEVGAEIGGEVVFAYVQGPRTKTRAENRLWAMLGAQVNSMTLGPEIVLARELSIPCVGLVVGHKYSIPDRPNPPDEASLAETLVSSRQSMERLIMAWLTQGAPVPDGNHLYRFGGGAQR